MFQAEAVDRDQQFESLASLEETEGCAAVNIRLDVAGDNHHKIEEEEYGSV